MKLSMKLSYRSILMQIGMRAGISKTYTRQPSPWLVSSYWLVSPWLVSSPTNTCTRPPQSSVFSSSTSVLKVVILLSLMLISKLCFGQQTEFTVYQNGLIYDAPTMTKLGAIVDSLNLRFRSCDLSHPYYSIPQGKATFVSIPNKEAQKLIESGASLETFRQRYASNIQSELWLIKYKYTNYKGNAIIEYSSLPGKGEHSINVKDTRANDKTSGWIMSDDKSEAFYFIKLERFTLPHNYARLVQYVDCMIDTTAKIFFPEAKGSVYEQATQGSKASEFIKFARTFPNEPKQPDYNELSEKEYDKAIRKYYVEYNVWDSLRILKLDEKMFKSTYARSLLLDAIAESIDTRNSSSEFEFYVSRYGSKEQALQLKRSRRVIGNCSQDQSPRYHAIEICQLAAATTQWDIFLRSHLDIMNDRFERQSDGSYAWAQRKTYLKELEALDIPAVDLLLGTCLRVSNVSDNHYFGSIGRVGRALTDATNKKQTEQKMLAMIRDTTLDPYNRLLIAYLVDNYAHNLEEEEKNACLKELEEATSTLPELVKKVWEK